MAIHTEKSRNTKQCSYVHHGTNCQPYTLTLLTIQSLTGPSLRPNPFPPLKVQWTCCHASSSLSPQFHCWTDHCRVDCSRWYCTRNCLYLADLNLAYPRQFLLSTCQKQALQTPPPFLVKCSQAYRIGSAYMIHTNYGLP